VSVNETTLFRTAALERLSTPDRLDQTLRLASSSSYRSEDQDVGVGRSRWPGLVAGGPASHGNTGRGGERLTESDSIAGLTARASPAGGRSRPHVVGTRPVRPATDRLELLKRRSVASTGISGFCAAGGWTGFVSVALNSLLARRGLHFDL